MLEKYRSYEYNEKPKPLFPSSVESIEYTSILHPTFLVKPKYLFLSYCSENQVQILFQANIKTTLYT